MSWALAVVEHLTQQLIRDDTLVLGCGAEHLAQLRLAAQSLSAENAKEQSCVQLEALIAVSYEKMTSASLPFLACWRRFHTDACILRSLANISLTSATDSIGTLDRAIIISGASGEGRLDLIHYIVRKIQTEYFPLRLFEAPTTLCLPSPKTPLEAAQLPTSFNNIPCLRTPPSFTSFQTQFSRSPFILRGYASDWPAMREHPWSSTSYLRCVSGPGRIVPVEVGKDYRENDWTQRLMNWDDFLSSIHLSDQHSATVPTEVLYLAQHNLLMQFPALRADICIPDYVYASLSPPDFPGYQPPRNEDQLVLNVWLGPKGTISPAHTDPYHNFYVQIVGRKTVWLAPPTISHSMYAYSPSDQSHNPATNTSNPSMSNTSRVDVFPEQSHVAKAKEEHPEFWNGVIPNALNATLEPGDLLFFPPGWWHAMRSEEASFSVSMWF